eukprot:7368707-Pyramimonas_sp.AAC.1
MSVGLPDSARIARYSASGSTRAVSVWSAWQASPSTHLRLPARLDHLELPALAPRGVPVRAVVRQHLQRFAHALEHRRWVQAAGRDVGRCVCAVQDAVVDLVVQRDHFHAPRSLA